MTEEAPDPNSIPTLGGALEDSGSVRPIGDLQQQGIQKVRVLSQSQLGEVLRVAVNRAVRRQLGSLDLPLPALEQLRSATEIEYARLLAEGLETAPGAATTPPPPPPPASVDEITAAPTPQAVDPQELGRLESRMAQNITQLLQRDWRNELQHVQESQQSQLSLLEQRIAKLVGALESTERVVQQIQTNRSTATDAPPTPDTPGGLDTESPLFERKSELLTALFQANMELRELQGRAREES